VKLMADDCLASSISSSRFCSAVSNRGNVCVCSERNMLQRRKLGKLETHSPFSHILRFLIYKIKKRERRRKTKKQKNLPAQSLSCFLRSEIV